MPDSHGQTVIVYPCRSCRYWCFEPLLHGVALHMVDQEKKVSVMICNCLGVVTIPYGKVPATVKLHSEEGGKRELDNLHWPLCEGGSKI